MPTPALRVIAGYETGERYSLPRCRVEPPSSLKRMLFPFIETELENVRLAAEGNKKDRPTAVCTLRLWSKLRTIILQDAAVLCLQYPSRKEHPVFRMPVFVSPEFLVSPFCFLSTVVFIFIFNSLFSQTFVEAMRSHLELVSDAVDTSLEASLPEIQRQFNQLHTEVKTGNQAVCDKVAGLGTAFKQSLDSRPTRVELAADFAAMAVRMAGGSSPLQAGQQGASNMDNTRTTMMMTTMTADDNNG